MTKEEAIRRIKAWNLDSDDMEVLSVVIPELAEEDEDERIRKELLEEIEFIIPHDDETDGEGLILPSYHARIDRYKPYLEKQKEQKHSLNFDAISSWLKDHVSRYINSEYNEFHHCFEYDGTIDVEKLIADLEVAVDSGIFNVHEQKEQNLEDIEDKAVRKYMKLDKFALANMLAERDKTNAEVIEIFKSIEEQPAEWNEDEKIRKAIIKYLEYHRAGEKFYDTTWDDAIVWLKKQKEQKPAEWNRQSIIDALTKWLTEKIAPLHKKSLDGTITEKEEMFEAALLEMRSLVNSPDFQIGKDTSAEWSEEDENAIATAIRACGHMTENFENSTKQYEDAMERLKSLRPQPHWKPSEEQMESLYNAVIRCKACSNTVHLPELYEDLKTL